MACDVCANLTPGAISGIVYASALPYMGPIMNEVGKPLVLSFLPGLLSTDDVLLSIRTKVAFIDSLFNDPDNVPVGLKWSWLGSSTIQDPLACKALLARTQDPGKLLEAGSKGLPLMMISGTRDTHIRGDVVVRLMEPHFKDVEVHTIQGGSHTLFYDNKEVFMKAVVDFATRVTRMATF